METRLSIFCDRLIEAGWLAAAIVTPLFINLYSYRVTEADKVALLRSLALTMVAAWLIKTAETSSLVRHSREGRSKINVSFNFLRQPLAGPFLLLAVVYILSTITSICPRFSFWGYYIRLQGSYTILSYLIFFFMIWQTLRTRRQLDRLITVILLTSWPVVLLGLMQHYGLNPLPRVRVSPTRVSSTLGNPIFLGAYLIMVVPLTLGQLVQTLFAARGEGKGLSRYLLIACYALFLLAQLSCLLFAQSRGPWLGLLGGFFLFLFLLAVVKRARGLALMVMLLAVASVLFLALLNLPNTPLRPLRKVPYLGRLGGLLETGGAGRVLHWGAIIDLVKSDASRALIGYGPESLLVALLPHYPPELARYAGKALPDHAHNDAFDALAMTGLVGLAVYLFLFGSVFYYGLKGLNLIAGPGQRKLFIALSVGGVVCGALIPRLFMGNWILAGVGVSLALVAALAIYVVIFCFCQGQERGAGGEDRILLIALLSAMVAHFIELTFGIGVAATRIYFCIYAGLLAAIASHPPQATSSRALATGVVPTEPAGEGGKVRGLIGSISRNPSLASYSLLAGLILGTMGFEFVLIEGFDLGAKNFSVLWFFTIVWLLGGLIIVIKATSVESSGGAIRSILLYLLLSLGCFVLFLVFRALSLLGGADGAKTLMGYYLWLFLAMAALAWILSRGRLGSLPLWRGMRGLIYAPLLVGIAGFILTSNLNLIRGDVYFHRGQKAAKAGRWEEALAFYGRALSLAPNEVVYYRGMGQVYFERARIAENTHQREALLEECVRVTERAKELDPLNTLSFLNLARVYIPWGQTTANPAKRLERFDKALECYHQAAALSPSQSHIFKEMGLVHLQKGEAYLRMGRLKEALRENLRAAELAPDDFLIHQNMAIIYGQLGRMDEAIAEAEMARDLAPEEKRPEIENLIAQLEAQKHD